MSPWKMQTGLPGRRSRILPVMTAAWTLSALACSGGKEYQKREPIEMGPFVFSVERASQSVSSGGIKEIHVVLELHNYEERFNPTFDDALNDNRPGSMIAFPRAQIVDREGNSFDGWVTPRAGGSRRSRRWEAKFPLVYPSARESLAMGAQESAAKYVDRKPEDFRLVIKNPDRRRGQPGRIWVQL